MLGRPNPILRSKIGCCVATKTFAAAAADVVEDL